MPEPASYPGSPSLSAEASEKVLQTFRHTLDMARAGRNEDALLGCDFILKMDARFAPARKLLASLRGIAAGTVVDLGEFDAFLGGASPAPPAPTTPPSGYGVPPAPAAAADPFASPGSGLDSLGFDDLAPNPFASAPAPAAPTAPAPSDFSFSGGEAGPAPSTAPDPFAAVSGFEAPATGADPFAAAELPSDPFASAAPASTAPAAPAAPPAAGVDPRITQFLRQGDEAEAQGRIQEAIDLWSRVFLIDLSNEDASRRIDAARDKQNEAARQLDVLLSEGVQLYEAGDLQSARNSFLKVLTLSESDATARNYLNEIDAALASARPTAPAPAPAAPAAEPYLRDELEPPGRPSFAEGLPSLEEHPVGAAFEPEAPAAAAGPEVGAAQKGGRIDGRILLGVAALVLAAVAVVAWLAFRPTAEQETGSGPESVPATTSPAADPLAKAQALFDAGKVEEALQLLSAIPPTDPHHAQALVLVDKFKSSAQPQPNAEPAVSEAEVDEARLAGFASLAAGRYIDAVKSLDVVAKARPDDTEAVQALARARDTVSALGAAIRSYNEQDYASAQRLLWDLRKQDSKNQDVEEYLFKSYFNDGVMSLQSGNMKRAAEAFREATGLRSQDAETQRHLKFARKYAGGPGDLASRIYVKHVSPRP